MGLNYIKRPPREELDSPNDFITVGMGATDINLKEHSEELIIDFENRILDRVYEKIRDLDLA